MASPSMTQGAAGNVVSAGTAAANGTSTPVTVDATTKFEVQLQFDVLSGGTAQSTATAVAKIYRVFGTGTLVTDTVPITQMQIAMGATATHYIASLGLPTGKYSVTLTNTDTANAITFVCTSSAIDAIA